MIGPGSDKNDTDHMKEDREAGGMGFGGSIPCAQTKGAKKFYTEDQTPEKLLHSGHYEKVSLRYSQIFSFFSFFSIKILLIINILLEIDSS